MQIAPLSGGGILTFFGNGSYFSFLSVLTTLVPAKIIKFLCFIFVSKISFRKSPIFVTESFICGTLSPVNIDSLTITLPLNNSISHATGNFSFSLYLFNTVFILFIFFFSSSIFFISFNLLII